MTIRIISAGIHSTIQDKGRTGYQSLGVPEGGVLDSDAMRLGNALVGNDEGAAVIEVCIGGIAFELLSGVRVALTGTSASDKLTIQAANGEVLEIPPYRSVDLPAGRIVRLGILSTSNSATIALSGGIDVPKLFGSMATSPNAKIGGLGGRLLMAGDIIPLGAAKDKTQPEYEIDMTGYWRQSDTRPVRIVFGPQDDCFTPKAIKDFTENPYRVGAAISRMGMRLNGTQLTHKTTADILSDGIVKGAVQVPSDGQPIILLADHQTTGGYTKIAAVISADLPRLARLRSGEAVQFAAVSVDEAEAIARAHDNFLEKLTTSLRPASALLDTAALYGLE